MKTYKIIQKKNLWFTLSGIVILIGFGFSALRVFNQELPFNFGIDFTGGSTMLISFDHYHNNSEPLSNANLIAKIRTTLKQYELHKSMIRVTETKEVLIRTIEIENTVRKNILDQLSQDIGPARILEADLIGPSIGAELRQKSLWIIVIVSFALLLYITWRFEFVFGIAALAALLHDALITLSLASLLFIEINTAFVAAILTILGYSINDTIVIFDRIRENMRSKSVKGPLTDVTNLAISQTIVRSINTSVTTLFFLVALLIFGGTTIKGFCLVLLIGILAGTYSSIFIASPVMVVLLKDRTENK